MTLIELTIAALQKPVLINLAHVTEIRPCSTGTDIWFAVSNGDYRSFGPDLISVSETYDHIVGCIRETIAGVPNVRLWAALNGLDSPDALAKPEAKESAA